MAAYLYEYRRVNSPTVSELDNTETRTPTGDNGWMMYGEYPGWMVKNGDVYEGSRDGFHGDYNNVILDSADELGMYHTMIPWRNAQKKINTVLVRAEKTADRLDAKIGRLRKSRKTFKECTLGELRDARYETAERCGIVTMRKRMEALKSCPPDYVYVGGTWCSGIF